MEEPSNPFHPIALPEFGLTVGWTMCRNTLCPNFGVHYSGPPLGGSEPPTDGRYRLSRNKGAARIQCLHCGKSFKVNSNQSIRPLARHYLSLSLPFADCPNERCANHGWNVFEHYQDGRLRRGRRYRREGEHRVRCIECGCDVTLGTPLRIHAGEHPRATKRSLRDILSGGVSGEAVLKVAFERGMTVDAYYARLRAAGERLRDCHAWRCAGLLQRKFEEWPGPVRVFTDTLTAKLWRWGDRGDRYQDLPIAVSVVELPQENERDTSFLLAAHPGFLPDAAGLPDEMAQYRDSRKPSHEALWSCVDHMYGKGYKRDRKPRPNIGSRGFYTTSPYMYLAHFLTVRRMLARFPVVHHYLDGEKTQAAAALTALADRIKAGRWEIVLYQDNEKPRSETPSLGRWPDPGDKRTEKLNGVLDQAWEDAEARWDGRRRSGGLDLDAPPDPRLDARLFGKASLEGADSERGGWAWLEYPPSGHGHDGGRCLWLTRRPGAVCGPELKDLLRPASVLPVDKMHRYLRTDAGALKRPADSADKTRSYVEARRDPLVVSHELWIAAFKRNFGVRIRALKKPPRAKAMGLTAPRERPADPTESAWSFRLGLSHAERISEWVRE